MSDGAMLAAASGTDQRLDAILAELRGLRADLGRAPVAVRQRVDRIADGVAALDLAEPEPEPETVELREPEKPPARPSPKAAMAPKRKR